MKEPESREVMLEDADGIETPYELIAEVEYEGETYAVLLPQVSFGEDELVILKIVRDSNGEIMEYHGINEFDVLEGVYEKFKSTL